MLKSDSIQWNTESETFTFLRLAFDVQKAKEIIRSKKPRKVESMSISEISHLVGEPPKNDGSPSVRTMGVWVNWGRVMTSEVDMDVPVILVQLNDSCLPIDGWHRIAKAKLEGRSTLPCVVLNKTESKLVQLR